MVMTGHSSTVTVLAAEEQMNQMGGRILRAATAEMRVETEVHFLLHQQSLGAIWT